MLGHTQGHTEGTYKDTYKSVYKDTCKDTSLALRHELRVELTEVSSFITWDTVQIKRLDKRFTFRVYIQSIHSEYNPVRTCPLDLFAHAL